MSKDKNIEVLFENLSGEVEHQSLDKAFVTIYEILKHEGTNPPGPTPLSKIFQVVNQKFTDGQSFSVPIEITRDGVLGIAAKYTLDTNITVHHGSDQLTMIGETKNNGITTKLFSATNVTPEIDSLTITVNGTGSYGPFGFYFAEEEDPIISVENYMGESSDGPDTGTITMSNAAGGKFVHIATWEGFNPYESLPMPISENENVAWGGAIDGRELLYDVRYSRNFTYTEEEGREWVSDPMSEWSSNNAAFSLSLRNKQKVVGVWVEFEFVNKDDPLNRAWASIFEGRFGHGSGDVYEDGVYYFLRKSKGENITGVDITTMSEVIVKKVLLATAEEDGFLTFAIGHSKVPAYEGQQVFYDSKLEAGSQNTISGAEIRK